MSRPPPPSSCLHRTRHVVLSVVLGLLGLCQVAKGGRERLGRVQIAMLEGKAVRGWDSCSCAFRIDVVCIRVCGNHVQRNRLDTMRL